MRNESPYRSDGLSVSCVPVSGGTSDDSGWWDVHTHRRTADWKHTILNSQIGDTSWSAFPSSRSGASGLSESVLPASSCGLSVSNMGSEPVMKSEALPDSMSSVIDKRFASGSGTGLPDSLSGFGGEPCFLSAGIHPWYLTEDNFPFLWEQLLEATQDARVVAIGEAGLDKNVEVSFEFQCSVFRKVAALADELQLPLLIHAVKASNEIVRLRKELRPRNPWIVHGFRGKKELARTYLQQGICLSYGEKYQDESLRITPVECMFIETDESKVGIRELYCRAAKVLALQEEELREKIEQNINKLFFRQ